MKRSFAVWTCLTAGFVVGCGDRSTIGYLPGAVDSGHGATDGGGAGSRLETDGGLTLDAPIDRVVLVENDAGGNFDASTSSDAGRLFDGPTGSGDGQGSLFDASTGGSDAGGQGTDNLWIGPACNGVDDYGRVTATFRGVAAHCTGIPDSYFQCTELANRFVRDALQHPTVMSAKTGGIPDICNGAATMPEYSVWGPGFRATEGHRPVSNDLLVYNNHISVVVNVGVFEGRDAVQVIQQNVSKPEVAWVDWNASTNLFTWEDAYGSPICWIHAEPAAPPAPPPSPDCGCWYGDVPYCGLGIVDHESYYECKARVIGGLAKYDTLYSCENGVFKEKEVCPTVCVTYERVFDEGYDDRLARCGPGFEK